MMSQPCNPVGCNEDEERYELIRAIDNYYRGNLTYKMILEQSDVEEAIIREEIEVILKDKGYAGDFNFYSTSEIRMHWIDICTTIDKIKENCITAYNILRVPRDTCYLKFTSFVDSELWLDGTVMNPEDFMITV